MTRFYTYRLLDDAFNYLTEWTEEFAIFQQFSWVQLRHFPNWTTVNKSIQTLVQKTSFNLIENSSAIFEQFGYVKNYCTEEKFTQWKNNNVSTEDRWI